MLKEQDQEIIQLGKKLQTLARKAVTQYKPDMDEIIDSGCRDKRRIECVLDGMLDFCFDENMIVLYKKLCRYYYAAMIQTF